METWRWEEDRVTRERQTLERHRRLHRLFKKDRFAFERERKRMIDGVINSAEDEDTRNALLVLQESWDRRMKGAGSGHNRFVLARTFFWEHIHEKCLPAMRKLGSMINDNRNHKETKLKVI